MNDFQIMDVTLRDGSYKINFQFSNTDVQCIGSGLDQCGIPYIEIGHGMGIGASGPQYGAALHTDVEYLQAAKESICTAKIGMFCVPGVASLEQVARLCAAGLDFVRVGTNVDAVESSEPYIRMCKKLGVIVMANYMKSYVMKPAQFAQEVKKTESYGADVVYLVDSAGSMLPKDILQYYDEIRKVSDLPLGFHGHNNLGLALSNSLYAAELGFSLIDASLQGLGRSAGNAALEHLVAVSQKMEGGTKADISDLLLLGKKYVARFIESGRIDPIDTICGIAGFHSSYLQEIHRCAGKFGVSPLDLITAYAKVDQVNMDESCLEKVAKQLPQKKDIIAEIDMHRYLVNEQGY